MRIGIIGKGIVGGALYHYLQEYHDVSVYDPAKELWEGVRDRHVVFICVPAGTLARELSRDAPLQDTTNLDAAFDYLDLEEYPKEYPVVIRSTVLPGTADRYAERTKRFVVSMPEFLTERQAGADILEQKHLICGGRGDLTMDRISALRSVFQDKLIHFMKNEEVELAKYAHNVFLSVKVNFWNIIRYTCVDMGLDYRTVARAANLVTGFVGNEHTKVPGPDGKCGFGGKCFPKDSEAFNAWLSSLAIPNRSIEEMIRENHVFRGEEI